jgi:DNA-binding transcriptional ArsR family regulator
MAKKGGHTDTLLKALGHELRRKIMRKCVERPDSPVSPREVSAELGESLSNVSYHVRVLAICEAVTLVDKKPVRGSMQHFYLPSPKFIGLPWVATVLKAGGDAA